MKTTSLHDTCVAGGLMPVLLTSPRAPVTIPRIEFPRFLPPGTPNNTGRTDSGQPSNTSPRSSPRSSKSSHYSHYDKPRWGTVDSRCDVTKPRYDVTKRYRSPNPSVIRGYDRVVRSTVDSSTRTPPLEASAPIEASALFKTSAPSSTVDCSPRTRVNSSTVDTETTRGRYHDLQSRAVAPRAEDFDRRKRLRLSSSGN